mmetsp:Transcript_18250/g.34771  ORF Transcript_18250/g.34771 Transcript_18250/m.34771 type:complete len:338 (+) Transcript_18250:785-1798(+)
MLLGLRGGRSSMLIEQRLRRLDDVAAAQLVFVGHDGLRGGRPSRAAVAPGHIHTDLPGHFFDLEIGLIAARSDGAGQGVQGSIDRRGCVVEEDAGSALNPIFVRVVSGDVRGMRPGSGRVARAAAAGPWEDVVDVGDVFFAGVVDHVGPGVVEGDCGHEGINMGNSPQPRDMRHANPSVFEIPDHIPAITAKDPQEQIRPGDVVETELVSRFFDAIPETHDGSVAELQCQRGLVVGQRSEREFGESCGLEGGLIIEGNGIVVIVIVVVVVVAAVVIVVAVVVVVVVVVVAAVVVVVIVVAVGVGLLVVVPGRRARWRGGVVVIPAREGHVGKHGFSG